MKLNLQSAILIFFAACSSLSSSLFAQYNRTENNNWTFGDSLGINFVNGVPNKTTSNLSSGGTSTCASAATISDHAGNLLFYTNGDRVYDKNHNLMPNGNLASLFLPDEQSFQGTQGALIIPFPNDDTKYYVFSATYVFYGPILFTGSYYYSVIDMQLNGGLGDVVNGYPILLESSDVEAQSSMMIAVPGNDCNIWLLRARGQGATSEYVAHQITEKGFDTTKIISAAPKEVSTAGYLAISPNNELLATGNQDLPNFYDSKEALILSKFNASTGQVTNSDYLDSTYSYYGIAFSPDNTKVYALAATKKRANGNKYLYQFDLTATNPAASRKLITSGTTGLNAIQLGPDGKIYVANGYSSGSSSSENIAVINKPNLAGTDCDYKASALTFSGKRISHGLQNLVMFPTKDSTITSQDLIFCEQQESVELSATKIDTSYKYQWSTGATEQSIAVKEAGTYIVSYGDYCTQFVDTFVVTPSDLTTTISVSGNVLSASGGPFTAYQWYLDEQPIARATNATYTVTENGDYSVRVTDETGCEYLSDSYTINNQTSINEFSNESIRIYPNPSKDVIHIHSPVAVNIAIKSIEGKSLIAEQGVSTINVSNLPQGVYLLQAFNQEGELLKTERIIKK